MKVELKIKRPNGTIEMVDISAKQWTAPSSKVVNMYREATRNAGRGEVICAIATETKTNAGVLAHNINNIQNEGGEGYEIDGKDMLNDPRCKTWIETTTIN